MCGEKESECTYTAISMPHCDPVSCNTRSLLKSQLREEIALIHIYMIPCVPRICQDVRAETTLVLSTYCICACMKTRIGMKCNFSRSLNDCCAVSTPIVIRDIFSLGFISPLLMLHLHLLPILRVLLEGERGCAAAAAAISGYASSSFSPW